MTIGVSCAIDLRRRRIPCGETDPVTLSWPSEHGSDADERHQLIWEAVQTLTDGERLIVLRRVVSETPYDGIAQELGVKTGSCRVTYLRAIKKLRNRLREWGLELTVSEPVDVIPEESTFTAPLPEGA
jgi:DNA-directed RNA polymerase specialized sigma24 family protein